VIKLLIAINYSNHDQRRRPDPFLGQQILRMRVTENVKKGWDREVLRSQTPPVTESMRGCYGQVYVVLHRTLQCYTLYNKFYWHTSLWYWCCMHIFPF